MENEKIDWNVIRLVAGEFWENELSYINDDQISAIQSSIENKTPVENNLITYDDGFGFDLMPLIECVKTIFEVILVVLNLVLLYKGTKSDDNLLLEVRKAADKSDNLNLKINETDIETMKKIIKMIKGYYGIR
ncbi:hypothetical protein LY28_01448 [Ruminiclostridium sufflavum DSM 19573]|uniref:Uncharacterized protein n=1 Tax=Ruminiclostridium sufflavum DSM 19573 TaxID=1121337 RepID=A0A318XMD6_9FIRM|nr:hypothetical protein [Ruminiclostridium sufflavum]PYG88597.1 hypothetical protein LY28_01448 [Ruminiclostridium sufflavum DSM 19573]